MILVAGAGAMADAARAMRQIQRDINRRVDRSKRRAKAGRYYGEGGAYEAERTDFDCVYLCGACGYFVDEMPGRAADEDAGEEQGDDETPSANCPACGEAGFYDLAIEPLAGRVRDMEAKERMQAPTWVTVTVVTVTVVLLVAAVVGLAMVGWGGWAAWVAMSAFFVLPLSYYVLPRPASVLFLRGRDRMPHRWHVPLALPDPDSQPARVYEAVEAQPVDATITAPISGRECVAFQICVLFDTPGDARPPEWALEEERAVDARFGDALEVSADKLFLETPVEQVDAPGGSPDPLDADTERADNYAEVKRFLRQRGLFITDGEYHFYEACLEPGDTVDVAAYDGESFVVRHSSAVDEALPQLPEPKKQ